MCVRGDLRTNGSWRLEEGEGPGQGVRFGEPRAAKGAVALCMRHESEREVRGYPLLAPDGVSRRLQCVCCNAWRYASGSQARERRSGVVVIAGELGAGRWERKAAFIRGRAWSRRVVARPIRRGSLGPFPIPVFSSQEQVSQVCVGGACSCTRRVAVAVGIKWEEGRERV